MYEKIVFNCSRNRVSVSDHEIWRLGEVSKIKIIKTVIFRSRLLLVQRPTCWGVLFLFTSCRPACGVLLSCATPLQLLLPPPHGAKPALSLRFSPFSSARAGVRLNVWRFTTKPDDDVQFSTVSSAVPVIRWWQQYFNALLHGCLRNM